MTTYKGFSFKNWGYNKSFVLTDSDLVKRDILNHIYTRRGERVHQRGFGTIIQDLLFEPFDDNTVVLISDQVRAVIDFDPRVVLLSEEDFVVTPFYDRGVLNIKAKIFYVELDLTDILDINLEFES